MVERVGRADVLVGCLKKRTKTPNRPREQKTNEQIIELQSVSLEQRTRISSAIPIVPFLFAALLSGPTQQPSVAHSETGTDPKFQ